jgi:hypothetical protein
MGRNALALVLLVSRSCETGEGFRSVYVLVAFGARDCSGVCRAWLLLLCSG